MKKLKKNVNNAVKLVEKHISSELDLQYTYVCMYMRMLFSKQKKEQV